MRDHPPGHPPALLRALFAAALAAADPRPATLAALPEPPRGRVLVLAVGKAAAPMAQAVEEAWSDRLAPERMTGLVVTPDGHDLPLARFETLSAAHPVPDARSEYAARRCLQAAAALQAGDLLLMLLSGGGSALLAAPAPGLTLVDEVGATRTLLEAGLPIGIVNAVRRRISAIKGGRLALAAYRARVLNLIVSDVPGDDPAVVASGPTLPSAVDAPEHALALLGPKLREALSRGEPPPEPGDPRLPETETHVILRARDMLAAAAQAASAAGCEVMQLGDCIEGDARSVAAAHAQLVRELQAARRNRPLVIFSGGETGVRVTGGGRGGRNTEYLLALGLALEGTAGVHALAADTDGLDGRGGHAGAILAPDSLARWIALGADAPACLASNDSRTAFERSGDLIVTGPTRTNLNDFRAIWLQGSTSAGMARPAR